jgi:hypothetical protein
MFWGKTLDVAEPVVGRRFAPTRWRHPGYACLSLGKRGLVDNANRAALLRRIIAETMLASGLQRA